MYGSSKKSRNMSFNDKDLEKFLRSFAVISVQTIVQSRLGERIQTKNAGPSQYWVSNYLLVNMDYKNKITYVFYPVYFSFLFPSKEIKKHNVKSDSRHL